MREQYEKHGPYGCRVYEKSPNPGEPDVLVAIYSPSFMNALDWIAECIAIGFPIPDDSPSIDNQNLPRTIKIEGLEIE